jgi:predicted dehydrogenase
MKKINVGMIGYGWAASAHIDAINATTLGQVTAVCSSRELDNAAVSAQHGGTITCYRDLDEMLSDPGIDAVSVASYPSAHADQVVKAAKAGKHLIIEKPLALNLEDCRRMRDAVAEAGVKSCVCFELRFSAQFEATRSLIDQGMLGSVHYGEIDYYHGIGPWYGQFRWNTTKENGGSSLLSAGCHALDALLFCMGSEVESVMASETTSKNETFAQYEYPTTTVAILNFADGRIGKVASVIDCLQPYYFHTHLVGSEGTLLDNKIFSTKIAGLKKEWSELAFPLCDSGDVSDHPYQAQFEAFFQALAEGKEMARTSLPEAYKTFETLFACDLSAREGRPVKLEELR